MRAIYTLLWYLALPLLPLRLLWRARREPGYSEHIGERFGRYTGAVSQPLLWVHAVSLGETRAAAPLVDRMRRAYPGATVLLTHMTATGRASGRALFGDRVVQAWLPYDVPFAVRAFLAHFSPRAGLIMETELWPNLVALAHEARMPLYLVNARMSARSARGYARVPALARPMLAALSGVAAQTPVDAKRLADLGARSPVVTGNLKFDASAPDGVDALGREFRRAFRHGAARLGRRLHARRRGGDVARRACRHAASAGHPDRDRSAPSAALRSGGRTPAPARDPVRTPQRQRARARGYRHRAG